MRAGKGLLGLLLVVAGLALAQTADARPTLLRVGIADQKASMFSDPRFAALGVRSARIAIAWDAMTSPWQRAELDDWLTAARTAGVEPLVTFGHSRLPGRRRVLPTPAQLGAQFRALRARYPWVRDFATWNEANYCGEPTCHKVALVVRYYKALRRACPSCRILAAEMLDFPNMAQWVRDFQHAARAEPAYWGLHNYRDANRLQTANTRALLRVTSGEVWFTETGGIVDRRNKSTVSFEESPAHAAVATRWVFDRLVPLSPRITRVFLYHWSSDSLEDTWDSALVGPDGQPRPALRVLRDELAALRRPVAPAAAAPAAPPPSPSPTG